MDSINREQQETNRASLEGSAAVEKIKQIVDHAENCFFCTASQRTSSEAARPMNVRQCDDAANLWFLSASDSHKNQELGRDPHVTLYFQATKHSEFLQLNGWATICSNRDKVAQLWEPILRTWFTDGIEDPRITVIKVEPIDGYYWSTKHGNLVAGVKMLVGAAMGKTLDDSIEGQLRV